MYLICIEIDFFKDFTAISISCSNEENSMSNPISADRYVNILVKMQELEDIESNEAEPSDILVVYTLFKIDFSL